MAVEFKDYYATLGVPRTATEEELKKAFRNLARRYHPDVAKDKKGAEDKFKEINEAYEVLSHPENRNKYDTLGADWKQGAGSQPPPGGRRRRGPQPGGGPEFEFGGTGFSDFFEQFFSRGGQRAGGFATERGPGHGSAQRGHDVEGDLAVSLEEVLRGTIRSVSLRSTDPATGGPVTQTFKVRIPVGVQDGQRIRVAGKGGVGTGGAAAGDLILGVRYSAHPEFRARAADLLSDLEIAPWEAVLGTTLAVPTLEGSVTLRVPAGTQDGSQLRVRQQGLPTGSEGRGDLYVTLAVKLPVTVTDEERVLWEALAKGSTFDPRAA